MINIKYNEVTYQLTKEETLKEIFSQYLVQSSLFLLVNRLFTDIIKSFFYTIKVTITYNICIFLVYLNLSIKYYTPFFRAYMSVHIIHISVYVLYVLQLIYIYSKHSKYMPCIHIQLH